MNDHSSRTLLFPTAGAAGERWLRQDRGNYAVSDGVLTVTDGWVSADGLNLSDVTLEFAARAPQDAVSVQIWAGFRHFSHDYRYVVALRGGANCHLYLARMGAEGYDKMLALRPLEWSPMPGVWYRLRVTCVGNTIAVWAAADGEALPADPLCLVTDDDAPFTAGSVSLGGSYLPTEFRDVSVSAADAHALDGVHRTPDYLTSATLSPEEREAARRRERAAYRPFSVPAVPEEHTELSLDGEWLFTPDYELHGDPLAADFDDSTAHIMTVPDSWIPLQAWLEGENMRELNKGMNDDYLVEELIRCKNRTFDYHRTKSAWYRHYLDLPRGIEQKQTLLDFEGIALISAIYVNGVRVRENIGMFTPMRIDVSEQVHAGRNTIAVEVYRRLSEESEHAVNTSTVDDNYATAWDILDAEGVETKCERREFCTDDIAHGFYMNNPGGIWRSVKLIIRDRVHVTDCFFVPTLTDATVQVTAENSGAVAATATLAYSLVHKTTGEYLCGGVVDTLTLAPGESRELSFKTPQVKPHLWGPGKPNLYRLTFTLERDGDRLDTYTEQVGFRTVAFDGATLLYNGEPLWVRGGNHMPAHVRPNDRDLARAFMRMALSHNVIASRTHVAPWGSAWLDAADEAGLLVSFEGTWSWLMLEHIPSRRSIELWKTELDRLIRRNRNRPSLFLMTMNNEMKFYLHEAPDEVVIEKGHILEGGVRVARAALPHLPLVCDSAYFRKHAMRSGRYERIIEAYGYDDGDMDDPHGYFGWYNPCFFHFMNGEFGRDYTLPDRPCMSQECATGYPRAQDGLPTRAYLFLHQTPQTTVGKKAYESSDPSLFLSRHAMLTKELVEMFRRVEHDRTCGVLLFAFETWFYHQHNSRRIQPMRSAEQLKIAYQPVLASAELFGRHFFAGDTLETAITLINDSDPHETLVAPEVIATLTANATGETLAEATLTYADLPYFAHAAAPLSLAVPTTLPAARVEATLTLRVRVNGRVVSHNAYDLLLGSREWGHGAAAAPCRYLPQDTAARDLLAHYGVAAQPFDATAGAGDRLVAVGALPAADVAAVRAFAEAGGRVILLDQRELTDGLLDTPAAFTAHRQEIVTMNHAESSVFDGLEPLDTAWFADGRQVPYVAAGRYHIDRFDPTLCALAETLEWHGYINKPTDYTNFGGVPLFAAKVGAGEVLVSALRTDAVAFDPVAARLNGNLIGWDFDMI